MQSEKPKFSPTPAHFRSSRPGLNLTRKLWLYLFLFSLNPLVFYGQSNAYDFDGIDDVGQLIVSPAFREFNEEEWSIEASIHLDQIKEEQVILSQIDTPNEPDPFILRYRCKWFYLH